MLAKLTKSLALRVLRMLSTSILTLPCKRDPLMVNLCSKVLSAVVDTNSTKETGLRAPLIAHTTVKLKRK
jgi:hypothetical protein